MADLIKHLEDAGFARIGTGGGCEAMTRSDNGQTIAITDIGGCDIPTDDSWMMTTFRGEWLASDEEEILDSIDSEQSPISLTQVIAMIDADFSECADGHHDTGRGTCADCGEFLGEAR